MRKRLALILVVLLIFAGAAAHAGIYDYPVDVDALKALESQDTFAVRVAEKKVIEGVFDSTVYDCLQLTVANGSAASVTQVRIGYVAYDDDHIARDVKKGSELYIGSWGSQHEIYVIDESGLSIAPGALYSFNVPVLWANFSGVRAMVQSYTDESGEVHVNPLWDQWNNMALGLSSNTGSSTVLD